MSVIDERSKRESEKVRKLTKNTETKDLKHWERGDMISYQSHRKGLREERAIQRKRERAWERQGRIDEGEE